MKQYLTQEQKSLIESLSQNDKATISDYESIWESSKAYEPNVAFNKDVAYNKFMNEINSQTVSGAKKINFSTILLRSAIALAVAFSVYMVYNSFFTHSTIKTGDNIEFVVLKDGTQIWINKHSELTYPKSFASHGREISLKGEAFFDVARDEDLPFTIDLSKDNQVTVLGTSFNINDRFNAKVEVSVSKGKVNLKNQKDNSLSLNLGVGEKGILNVDKGEIRKEEVDGRFLAWKESKLDFDAETLKSVLEGIGTFYGIQFRLDKIEDYNCEYTTSISRELKVAKVLETVQKAFPNVVVTKTTTNLYDIQGGCK